MNKHDNYNLQVCPVQYDRKYEHRTNRYCQVHGKTVYQYTHPTGIQYSFHSLEVLQTAIGHLLQWHVQPHTGQRIALFC